VLVVFEGPDGCGKSTLMHKVAQSLTDKGYKVIETREPGGCPETLALREMLCNQETRLPANEETDFYAQDCKIHTEKFIQPYMNQGYIVLCDRYYLYSNWVYQTPLNSTVQEHRAKLIADGIHKPDLTILLTTLPQVCRERVFAPNREKPTAYDIASKDEYNLRYAHYMQFLEFEEVMTTQWNKPLEEQVNDVVLRITNMV
jgi:dTMP kinase